MSATPTFCRLLESKGDKPTGVKTHPLSATPQKRTNAGVFVAQRVAAMRATAISATAIPAIRTPTTIR